MNLFFPQWEHKCLELVAEKQMVLETAVVPRDTRLAHLERSLAEKTDTVHELRQQRSLYLSQISDANQRLAEMEASIASLQSTIAGKDSLIQMLQQSFLEPDDFSCVSSQDDQMSSSLHHSPVSAKKFSLNGHISGGGGGGGGMNNPRGPGGHYDQLSLQIPPPSLPTFHHRLANGAHAHSSRPSSLRYADSSLRGYQGEMGSPVRGYVNCSLPSSPVKAVQYESRAGSLSPIKKTSDRGTHKYYTLELPDDMVDGGSTYYRGPVPPGTNVGGGGGVGGSGLYSNHTPSATHKLSLPISNSAPNSPSLRKVSPHKPRISQPSLHHTYQPHPPNGGIPAATLNGSGRSSKRDQNLSDLTRLGSPPKYKNPKGGRQSTGDTYTKRDHIRPPSGMKGKSKTPPPNYKLDLHHRQMANGDQSTRVGGEGGGGNSPQREGSEQKDISPHHHHHGRLKKPGHHHHHKQRHHSVDDVLNGGHEMREGEAGTNLSMNSNSSITLALFESLLGDSLPKGSMPTVVERGGAGRRRNVNSHRHSKSSPTHELIHL